MGNVKLCKTKAGRGFKVVIDDEWFYTSKYEMYRLMNDEATACDFRKIDDNENNGGQHEEQVDLFMAIQDDHDDFDYVETGWTKELHAFQDYLLEYEDGGEE